MASLNSFFDLFCLSSNLTTNHLKKTKKNGYKTAFQSTNIHYYHLLFFVEAWEGLEQGHKLFVFSKGWEVQTEKV